DRIRVRARPHLRHGAFAPYGRPSPTWLLRSMRPRRPPTYRSRVPEREVGAMEIERFDTVVIGGAQAGLSAGYHLRKAGRSFAIVDANERVGDTWRQRYDSLRLFTPARYIGLPGGRFPGKGSATPTKDEMADYLESYAARFSLPVRTGVRVERVRREGDTYVIEAGASTFEGWNAIVALGAPHAPRVPGVPR